MTAWPSYALGENWRDPALYRALWRAVRERLQVSGPNDAELPPKFSDVDYTAWFPEHTWTRSTINGGYGIGHSGDVIATGDGSRKYHLTFPHLAECPGHDLVDTASDVRITVTVEGVDYIVKNTGAPTPTDFILEDTGAVCGKIEPGNLIASDYGPGGPTRTGDLPYTEAYADVEFPVDVPPGTEILGSWNEDRSVMDITWDASDWNYNVQTQWEGCNLVIYGNRYEIDWAGEVGGVQRVILRGPGVGMSWLGVPFSIAPTNARITAWTFWRLQLLIMDCIVRFVNHTAHAEGVAPGDFSTLADVELFTTATFKNVAGMTLFPRVPSWRVTGAYDSGTGRTVLTGSEGSGFVAGHVGHLVHVYGVGSFGILGLSGTSALVAGDHRFDGALKCAVLPLDYTNKDDGAFVEGLCQGGDVLGPWLFYWAQRALQHLKWSCPLSWKQTEEAPHLTRVRWDSRGENTQREGYGNGSTLAAAIAMGQAQYDAATPTAVDYGPEIEGASWGTTWFHSLLVKRFSYLHWGPFTDLEAHQLDEVTTRKCDIDFYISGLPQVGGLADEDDWPGTYAFDGNLFKWSAACVSGVDLDATPEDWKKFSDIEPGNYPDAVPADSDILGWRALDASWTDCRLRAVCKWDVDGGFEYQ